MPSGSGETAGGRAPPVELGLDYVKGYVLDTRAILTSPARWDLTDWMTASLAAAVTAGLLFADDDVRDWAQQNRSGTTNTIADIVTPLGSTLYVLPSLGAVYLYGRTFEDDKAQRTALLGFESVLISALFTNVIKQAGHRHRPDAASPHTWDGPAISASNLSFPSGHSSTAFAAATVVASEYGDHRFVPPVAYGLATLAALARVHDNKHWASDIFMGAVIGFFTSRTALSRHRDDRGSGLTIRPVADPRAQGIVFEFHF